MKLNPTVRRLGLACMFLLGALQQLTAADPFFQNLNSEALRLAKAPYAPRESRVPAKLLNPEFTYDQYRDIRFDPKHAWWKDEALPFQLQFFHPGFIYAKTVQLSEVVDGAAKPIPFSTALFSYGPQSKLDALPSDMGYTGFRVHYSLNDPAYLDELIVFQGASYFRALGRGMRYGLSARGLAVDTAAPSGEEFPDFVSFYLVRPTKDADAIKLYALLDSPSVAGVYQFEINPGDETVTTVTATLYLRAGAEGKTLGLAPLTSMFWYGENSEHRFSDLRPEVHDSDGLLMERGNGERIWRPLTNPEQIRTSSFSDENPRGFGLSQRDRAYANYEDMEADYHLRPSTWVEPIGNWGAGSVRLVELSTPDETHDNIVAFWVPEKTYTALEPITFSYRLHWLLENPEKMKRSGHVLATRLGHSKTHEPELRRFWVDFHLPTDLDIPKGVPIEASVTVGDGAKLTHQTTQYNHHNGTWRVAFSIRPDEGKKPVELRCFLRAGDDVLSETWSYLWTP